MTQARQAATKETEVATNAKANARDRKNAQRRRFFDEQILMTTLQEQRHGSYEQRDARRERLDEVRKSNAIPGRTRANLASLHTKEHRFSAILAVLKGLADKHSKNYCFPSQDTLCWLLWRYYGVCVSRRTLNYDLQDLDDAGAISRTRRHKRLGRRFRASSTLYLLTKKGQRMLGLFSKLFKFLRKTRVQNIAQHTSLYSKGESLYGSIDPMGQAKGCPSDGSLSPAGGV